MEVFRPGCGLDAENRLKRGELKAAGRHGVLELASTSGRLIWSANWASTRSIAALLHARWRAEHKRGGLPKADCFRESR